MKRTEFWDDYDHNSKEIEYICENLPYTAFSFDNKPKDEHLEKLLEDFNSTIINSCNCLSNCVECIHSKNYILTSELILNPNRPCKDLIYECSNTCKCLKSCGNRLVQYGPRVGLVVKDLEPKGKGLVSLYPIPEGAFICEYAGEILTNNEALRRDQKEKMNYICCLNEKSMEGNSSTQTFIDPTRIGNIGRYLNHSCDANCFIISVRIDSPIPKLGIFSKRFIQAGEELCFNYGGVKQNEDGKKCFCGAKTCKGYLPNLSF